MKRKTYRIQNIPIDVSAEQLHNVFRQTFQEDQGSLIETWIYFNPSCSSGSTKDALVQFSSEPSALKPKKGEIVGVERTIATEWGFLSIDSHFLGLTQINGNSFLDSRDELKIDVDIVFIAGLDGHAYGSWTGRNTGKMWPRDFLSEDLPNARVMIFGYNSKLTDGTTHTFEDFCSQLLANLKLARQDERASKRNLILIGHSYGGRLITRILSRCKTKDSDSFYRSILTSLRCIVFFGAPHQGLEVVDFEKYLESAFANNPSGEFRKRLVAELKSDNPAALRELQDFKDLIGQDVKAQIISVYERKASQRLVQKEAPGSTSVNCKADPKWAREGEFHHPLMESSALLGFPSWMEKCIPSDSDHSNIAKIDRRDETYFTLLYEIKGSYKVQKGLHREHEPTYQLARQIQSTLPYQEPIWISFESLYFASEDMELIRERPNWLQRFIESIHLSESATLKLKPKRYGAVWNGSRFEPVMAEFRPCPGLDSIDFHYVRRREFEDIARIILNSSNGSVQFPSVPLYGISVCYASPEPCFLFVYNAQNLITLNEYFGRISMPSVQDRLWLACQCVMAVAALHKHHFWHGLINYFNIYMQLPHREGHNGTESIIRESSLKLAGFEILRSDAGLSDLVDVEHREERVFLHPERLLAGDWKERQRPEHDLFSLGILMTAIGLWTPFSVLKKYQNAKSEDETRSFVSKLRKQFKGDGTDGYMPGKYADIISYCLGRNTLDSLGQFDNKETDPQVCWKKAQYLVQILSSLLDH